MILRERRGTWEIEKERGGGEESEREKKIWVREWKRREKWGISVGMKRRREKARERERKINEARAKEKKEWARIEGER